MSEALNGTSALPESNKQTATPRDCCGNCIAWLFQVKGRERGGVCRYNPPTPFLVQGGADLMGKPVTQVISQFPPMAESGWCAQHTPFETDETEDAATV